jgi:hypothetical protein
MTPLPLPSQTLAWLIHAADAGQCDAQALLHLIARADKRDQDVAKFVDSYSSTIAALCRRLEALERGAGLRHPVEDAEAAQPDSDADTAQRITDAATQIRREAVELATASAPDHAGLIAFARGREPWSTWLQQGGCLESAHYELSDLMLAVLARWGHSTPPTPAAPVDDTPVANALLQAEAALADVAEGESGAHRADECLHWAETRCIEALATIRLVLKKHGIQTSEWPAAAPAPTPPPTAPADGLVERVANAMGPSTQAAMDTGELPFGNAYAAIREVAAWLDSQGHQSSANVVRWRIDG